MQLQRALHGAGTRAAVILSMAGTPASIRLDMHSTSTAPHRCTAKHVRAQHSTSQHMASVHHLHPAGERREHRSMAQQSTAQQEKRTCIYKLGRELVQQLPSLCLQQRRICVDSGSSTMSASANQPVGASILGARHVACCIESHVHEGTAAAACAHAQYRLSSRPVCQTVPTNAVAHMQSMHTPAAQLCASSASAARCAALHAAPACTHLAGWGLHSTQTAAFGC